MSFRCSVHSFKAAEVSIGSNQDIRVVEGNWVDVGKQHLTLAVVVPELEEDAEDPPPDLLDIFYSDYSAPSTHLAQTSELFMFLYCIDVSPTASKTSSGFVPADAC